MMTFDGFHLLSLGEIRAKGLFNKIGAITKPLVAGRDEIRTQECNVGNMIADIIRQYTNSTFGDTDPPPLANSSSFSGFVGFINSGALRLDGQIPEGIITVGDILR